MELALGERRGLSESRLHSSRLESWLDTLLESWLDARLKSRLGSRLKSRLLDPGLKSWLDTRLELTAWLNAGLELTWLNAWLELTSWLKAGLTGLLPRLLRGRVVAVRE